MASVKDVATEFLVVSTFAGSSGGATISVENHFVKTDRLQQYIAMNSYYYSSSYYACIAHLYDQQNYKINLYESWVKLVGTQNELTSILSLVWYR